MKQIVLLIRKGDQAFADNKREQPVKSLLSKGLCLTRNILYISSTNRPFIQFAQIYTVLLDCKGVYYQKLGTNLTKMKLSCFKKEGNEIKT